jgi:hypothetical protein
VKLHDFLDQLYHQQKKNQKNILISSKVVVVVVVVVLAAAAITRAAIGAFTCRQDSLWNESSSGGY